MLNAAESALQLLEWSRAALESLSNRFNAQSIRSELILIGLRDPGVKFDGPGRSLSMLDNPVYRGAVIDSRQPAPFLAALVYHQLPNFDTIGIRNARSIKNLPITEEDLRRSNGMAVFDISNPLVPRLCFTLLANNPIPLRRLEASLSRLENTRTRIFPFLSMPNR